MGALSSKSASKRRWSTGELLSDDEVLIGRKAISSRPYRPQPPEPLLRPGVVLRCVAPCDLFAAPGLEMARVCAAAVCDRV